METTTSALPCPPAQERTDWEQTDCPGIPSRHFWARERTVHGSCSALALTHGFSSSRLPQALCAAARTRPQGRGSGVSQPLAYSGMAAGSPHAGSPRQVPVRRVEAVHGLARLFPAAARWRRPRPGPGGPLERSARGGNRPLRPLAPGVRRGPAARAAAAGQRRCGLCAPCPSSGWQRGVLREFPARPRGSGFSLPSLGAGKS